MSMTDPIADFLTRIRNASRAGHPRVDVPYSRLKKEITRILLKERFITDYQLIEFQGRIFIRILLKFQTNGKGVIEGIERISRPGLRNYVGKNEVPRVLDGLGLSVLTTSRGVMSGREAKKLGLGGEVLCNVW